MPRVETIVQPEAPELHFEMSPSRVVLLRPGEIALDAATEAARPGPASAKEPDEIRALAQSLASPVGQIVPCIVERRGDLYMLVDGRRRRLAALELDSDEHPFYLSCVVRRSGEPLRTAIQANLQRKGYNLLQFAYLCKSVRDEHGWIGTKEVAEYLNCSRAQVGRADKLLTRPGGMDQVTYDNLLADIATGSIRADTALWALTHVKPDDIPVVMALAQALAEGETEGDYQPPDSGVNGSEARPVIGGSIAPPQDEPIAPASPEGPPRESGKTSRKASATPETVKDREWMKEQRKKSKERKLKAKAEKRHVKAAARKVDAVKTDAPKARGRAAQADHAPMQRTLPDLRKLFEVLSGTSYPDVMRSFVSLLAGGWWVGDASDKDVIAHWSQIAVAVELGEKIDKRRAQMDAVVKRTKATVKSNKKAS